MRWPWQKKPTCQLLVYPKTDWCGEPAIACCVLFGEHKNVCAFHAWDGKEDALAMLARTLRGGGARCLTGLK